MISEPDFFVRQGHCSFLFNYSCTKLDERALHRETFNVRGTMKLSCMHFLIIYRCEHRGLAFLHTGITSKMSLPCVQRYSGTPNLKIADIRTIPATVFQYLTNYRILHGKVYQISIARYKFSQYERNDEITKF